MTGLLTGARRGVRPLDVVMTTLLCGLTGWLVALVVTTTDAQIRVDSHSWWQLPVFLLATVPVLWWRRDLTAALAVMVAAMAVHLVAFGHVVRCGAGLPTVFVVSYLVGHRYERRQGLPALALAAVYSALVLAWDTAAGPEILPVVLLIQAVLWGVGQVVRSRSALADQLRARTHELQALRDERAALEVADDRARVSLELQVLLDERLAALETAAAVGDPAALEGIETDGRRTLDDMRRVVGVLRGGEAALAPAPSVAHVEGLLARRGSVPLTVDGDPRVLPPSLELSAYRIVEHLVGILGDGPDAAVVLSFSDDALEVRVTGRVPRGADVRGAVTRARQRALLHAGSLEAKVARGRARIVATLPTSAGPATAVPSPSAAPGQVG